MAFYICVDSQYKSAWRDCHNLEGRLTVVRKLSDDQFLVVGLGGGQEDMIQVFSKSAAVARFTTSRNDQGEQVQANKSETADVERAISRYYGG